MKADAAIWMVRLPPVAGPTLNQPLGFMYLASALRRAGFWNVRIIDIAPQRLTVEEVLKDIEKERPAVLFFTACTVDIPTIARFSQAVRMVSKNTRMVVGGPHPTGEPISCLDSLPSVDVAVIGEGEDAAKELMYVLEPEGTDGLDEVAGIAYRDNRGEIRKTTPRELSPTLDDDLWPAYDLIDIPAYFRYQRMGVLFRRPEYMSLFTSRGCSYRCTFCHGIFGSKVRGYSAKRVVDEIEMLFRRYGIREIQIVDDLFNYDSERLLEICDGLLRRGIRIDISGPNGLRGDRLSDDEVRALRRAGWWRMNVAVETPTPRFQALIKKNLDLDKVARVITLSAKEGMLTQGFFMLGFPGETEEEIDATIKWAEDSDLHLALFFRVIPMFGTALRADASNMGFDVSNVFTAHEGNGSNFNLSSLPDEVMEAKHREAYRRFFGSPKRLARLVARLPISTDLLPVYAYEAFTRLVIGTSGPHLIAKARASPMAKMAINWLLTGDAYGKGGGGRGCNPNDTLS